MSLLHQVIADRVSDWRSSGYSCTDYPAISEILTHAYEDADKQQLRYLRVAQFNALEVYWYLRLILKTPKTLPYTNNCFPSEKIDCVLWALTRNSSKSPITTSRNFFNAS